MAKKETTPSFTLTLELQIQPFQVHIIEKHLEVGRQLYNTVLGELLKRFDQLKRTKHHQKWKRQLRAVTHSLSQYEKATSTEGMKKRKHYEQERTQLLNQIIDLQKAFGLTEYDTHEWVKEPRKYYTYQPLKKNGKRSEPKPQLHSAIAQKVATRAWNTFYKLVTGKAKQVRFQKKGEFTSLEGKQAHTGIVYDKTTQTCSFAGLTMPVLMKKKDVYAMEALGNRVKYARIKKKIIRGTARYYMQLILEGIAPPKRDKATGKFTYTLGTGRVGIDIGTRSVAVVGSRQVILQELAPHIQDLSQEIRRIQRKMERSKRRMNPRNYQENGTVKRGRKTWVYSKRYLRLKAHLKELHRKQADKRKQEHRQLVNQLLSFGDSFFIETMLFQALQKRVKKTEISEKTGKYKRKKRFGKSIGQKAPALFVSLLEEKVKRVGGSFYRVHTQTFKASQYDHMNQTNVKKSLSKRWHVFEDGTRIQRDVYSAYLLSHSNQELTHTEQELCEQYFESFKQLHDTHISDLTNHQIQVANSGL